jgi:superfamily II DNA helicase RecQ
MNLKIFRIRLDDKNLTADQEAINQFMEKVTVKKTATQFVPDEPDYWSVMVYYENGKSSEPAAKETEKFSAEPNAELSPEEKEIIAALKQWRKDKASALNVPDFLICHNSELLSLTKKKPRTMAQLRDIKGFGDQKIAKHGDEIISVLNAF